MTNIRNYSCKTLLVEEYKELAIARGSTGLVCSIICCVILLIMICYQTRKRVKKRWLEWLVIYLAGLTIVDDLLFAFIMLPALSSWVGFCRALGIGLEIVNWVQQGCTVALSVHQLRELKNIVHCIRTQSVPVPKTEENTRMSYKNCYRGFALLVWLPVILNVIWLPFDEDDYDLDEPEWCWIVSITNDCELDGVDFAEDIIMWFIPAIIVCLTTTFTALATVCVWVFTTITWSKYGELLKQQNSSNSMVILITYSLFAMQCIMEIAVRTYTTVYNRHNYLMWMVYAIAFPFRDLLLPIGYTVQAILYRTQSETRAPSLAEENIVNSQILLKPDRHRE